MAKQLMLPANRAFNSNGLAVPHAVAKLYTTGTLTPQPFYADAGLTTLLGSTLTANGAGRFTPSYQDESTPFRLRLEDQTGAELDDIDPFYFGYAQGSKGDPGSPGEGYATRSAIAALSAHNKDDVYLTEAGREGKFVFDSSNLSTKVTADTAQGIYVPPASDTTGASGAWVRKFDGPYNAKWFGAKGDGTTNDGPAIVAAIALAKTLGVINYAYNTGSVGVYLPSAVYNMGSTTIDITHAFTLFGDFGGAGGGTVLKWTSNVTGIRVQGYGTSGDTGTGGTGWTGNGAVIRNLFLEGAYTTAESEAHGIFLRATATIRDVFIQKFAGDGVHIYAAAPTNGNVNGAELTNVMVQLCRTGFYCDGPDVNACVFTRCINSSCRRWGFHDSSFLGNTYVGCQAASNGGFGDGLTAATPVTMVTNGTYRYVPVLGTDGASTNPPPATATDNAYWIYYGVGGTFSTFVPTWTSGIYVRSGGAYASDDPSAANVFLSCYSEGDQGKSQILTPAMVIGGLHGAGGTGGAPFVGASAGALVAGAIGGQVKRVSDGRTLAFVAGSPSGAEADQVATFGNDASGARNWSIKCDTDNTTSFCWANGPVAMRIHTNSGTIGAKHNYSAEFPGGIVVSAGKDITANSDNTSSTTARNPAVTIFDDPTFGTYGLDLGYVSGGYCTRLFAPTGKAISFAGASASPTLQSNFTEWAHVDVSGIVSAKNLTASPPASATPANNGQMTFQLTNDTTLVVKVKGSDGTVRSATLTLA